MSAKSRQSHSRGITVWKELDAIGSSAKIDFDLLDVSRLKGKAKYQITSGVAICKFLHRSIYPTRKSKSAFSLYGSAYDNMLVAYILAGEGARKLLPKSRKSIS